MLMDADNVILAYLMKKYKYHVVLTLCLILVVMDVA